MHDNSSEQCKVLHQSGNSTRTASNSVKKNTDADVSFEIILQNYHQLLLGVKLKTYCCKSDASAGNRTRAARVAGEHSTTEPPMHIYINTFYEEKQYIP